MKKNLMLVLALFGLFSAQVVQADPRVAQPVQQNTDGGQINASNLYEMTFEAQEPWYYLGSQDRYILLYDRNDPFVAGLPPVRNLAFRVPNLGSLHVVFRQPEVFRDNLVYCISDDPIQCSPAGGPEVSGFFLTD